MIRIAHGQKIQARMQWYILAEESALFFSNTSALNSVFSSIVRFEHVIILLISVIFFFLGKFSNYKFLI
jgi:hypothetical protein